MTWPKKIIFLVLILLSAMITALCFEGRYRTLIRFLYRYFTNGKISFIGKNFHFFSLTFIWSFGIFCVIMAYIQIGQSTTKVIRNVIVMIFILILTTSVICYFGSQSKIIECTACDDGNIRLHYNEVNYNLIFLSSLIITSLPNVIKPFKNKKSFGNHY